MRSEEAEKRESSRLKGESQEARKQQTEVGGQMTR